MKFKDAQTECWETYTRHEV